LFGTIREVSVQLLLRHTKITALESFGSFITLKQLSSVGFETSGTFVGPVSSEPPGVTGG
jgi:hypothetical protein